ncbi:DUF2188 domain-containing protein [Streptomyces sp. NBC_00285]|uniref:DUF2188 domain-containing protein n=1 Tax=Streptomyces sp. NBC_00285 TaxID=2975700 RepID=UPI002E2DBA9B|nr:DUF2188 domain-containing protein [Streptomyces sp. NBC_00285]
MSRTTYRVLPNRGDWILRREQTLLASHTIKSELVKEGQRRASNDQPSKLVVHKADGTIEYEYTYGDDPYPPQG